MSERYEKMLAALATAKQEVESARTENTTEKAEAKAANDKLKADVAASAGREETSLNQRDAVFQELVKSRDLLVEARVLLNGAPSGTVTGNPPWSARKTTWLADLKKHRNEP